MAEQYAQAIFCYSYLVYHPQNPGPAGFTVNLYANDVLVYTAYNAARQPLGDRVFQIGPEIRERYFRMLNYAMPWLRHVPERIASGYQPATESSFGFYGQPLFRIEDLDQMMTLPFGSQRGHYARQVYNLLEDISSVLNQYGFDLRPDDFAWQSDVVEQMPLQYMHA